MGVTSTVGGGGPRQSKRKKTVPQKVQPASCVSGVPGVADPIHPSSPDDVAPSPGADLDPEDGESPGEPRLEHPLLVMGGGGGESPAGEPRGGGEQQHPLLVVGRESDGDTDEEMFFQVNPEGVITWQGSSLLDNDSPDSDLGLVSAYQMDPSEAGGIPEDLAAVAAGLPQFSSPIPVVTDVATTAEDSVEIDAHKTSATATVTQGNSRSNKSAAAPGTRRRRRNNNGPYECKVCHKLFAQSSSRNRHTKLHYGIYDYACDVCGRQFARREHLKTHVNKCPGPPKPDQQPTPPRNAGATGQPTPGGAVSPGTRASFGLLQDSFGDVIMIQ